MPALEKISRDISLDCDGTTGARGLSTLAPRRTLMSPSYPHGLLTVQTVEHYLIRVSHYDRIRGSSERAPAGAFAAAFIIVFPDLLWPRRDSKNLRFFSCLIPSGFDERDFSNPSAAFMQNAAPRSGPEAGSPHTYPEVVCFSCFGCEPCRFMSLSPEYLLIGSPPHSLTRTHAALSQSRITVALPRARSDTVSVAVTVIVTGIAVDGVGSVNDQ